MSSAPALLREDGSVSFMSAGDAFQFLDHAVRLNNDTPDGSVIKFAVAAVAGRLKDKAAADVLQYVINLAWHYPILLPYLEKIDAPTQYYVKADLIAKLNAIIDVNILHRRSDGICWGLYYLERLGVTPLSESVDEIIKIGDCVALAMLCNFDMAIDRLVNYSTQISEGHIYVKDQHWFFLYQLYRMGKIENPYAEDDSFELLKRHDVNFFCATDKNTRAEDYCFVLSNPFVEPNRVPSFDEWMAGVECDPVEEDDPDAPNEYVRFSL